MRRAVLSLALCWVVSAQPGRVIDGDTFEAQVLAYPRLIVIERVRVLGVDTPEMKAATLGKAQAAKSYTDAWLTSAGKVTLGVGCGDAPPYDSFGRVLATVTRLDGRVLADDLIAAKHGVKR